MLSCHYCSWAIGAVRVALRFRTADSAFPHDIETYMMFEHVRTKKTLQEEEFVNIAW